MTSRSIDELIAEKEALSGFYDASREAMDEVERICEYNDSVGVNCRRISAATVVDKLRSEFGWEGNSRRHLNKLCQKRLGRQSYGTK